MTERRQVQHWTWCRVCSIRCAHSRLPRPPCPTRVQRVVALVSSIRRRSLRDCRPAAKVHWRASECAASAYALPHETSLFDEWFCSYLFARIDLRAKQVETKGALMTTALSGPILVTSIGVHRVTHLWDKRASLSNKTAACLIVETFASEELTRTWIRSRQYSGRMTGLRSVIPRSPGAWRSSSRIILSM